MENSNSATTGQQQPSLPPGFRFHPTDEELVVHYLKKKATSAPLPVAIIAEVDLYKYDPWELPEKATYGEQEWYFFSPRDRKYPNGARPNRAATSGYWKATGTDKPVIASSEGNRKVGVKKALVFYGGKPPKGIKTNWIMHEYRLADNKACSNSKPPGFNLGNKKNSLRLDDWVLCRIYEKRISNKPVDVDHEREACIDYMAGPIPPSIRINGHPQQNLRLQLPMAAAASAATGFSALLENDLSLHQRMISHHGQNSTPYSELASSSTTKPSLPSLPMKRTLEPYPSWDEEYHPAADPPSSKRLQLTDSSDNSITTLLSQLPPLQQQTIQGCIGDGLFRPAYQLPETNWYS